MIVTGTEKAREVLDDLLRGNAAYVSGDSPSQAELSSAEVRRHLSDHGQRPDAAIIACADSRVGPEIIFSAGIGRLFVIRNAGNIVTERSVQASLEFAVTQLKVGLVIVCGHTKCGAITAAVDTAKSHSHSHSYSHSHSDNSDNANGKGDGNDNNSNITELGKYVGELAKVVKQNVGSPEEVKDAILTNIRHGVHTLKFASGPVSDAYTTGAIDIIGALYDIHTGQVYVVDQ